MNLEQQAMQCARDIELRPDTVPWRHIERLLWLRSTNQEQPLCPEGEHESSWDDEDEALRCVRCGLNCT